MIPRAQLAPPALTAGLALLLAVEWLLPGPRAAVLAHPPGIPKAATAAADDDEIARWAGIVLARPLLSDTRRPPPAAGVTVDDTLPRLSAIIVIGGTRRAIFATEGAKPQAVSAGGAIGVYRVTQVAPDKVELQGPDGKLSVKPQFLAADRTAPAHAPAR